MIIRSNYKGPSEGQLALAFPCEFGLAENHYQPYVS